jgi:LmbE family N-acetylglucosaminyl deacetylase
VAARDHLFLPALSEVDLIAHTPLEIYFAFPHMPDLVVDITDFLEKKLEALAEHGTQTKRVPKWKKRAEELAVRAAEGEEFKYGEAFKRLILSYPKL